MVLSKIKMQKIVEELRGSIAREINIMDKTGEIIASSDPTRLGIRHQGAIKIINQRMDELLIEDETNFKGARHGINLPIFINDEIVGVVGITGEREEVEPFGKIIKKMTEIMITEEYLKDQRQLIENTKNHFVYTWLFETVQDDEKERDNFILSGRLLEIDVLLERAIVVLHIFDLNEKDKTDMERQLLNNRIIKHIRRLMEDDGQSIVVQIGIRIVILLHTDTLVNALEKMNLVKEHIESYFRVKMAGGIGSIGSKPVEIRRSYREAEVSCDLMVNIKNMGIKAYGDMDLELLIQSIPSQNQISYFKKMFSKCPGKNLESYLLLLRVLIENDGSINKTAEQLYLHKNTVQYRLIKLKELTGYDPRIMKDVVPLYIALLIYEENKENLCYGIFKT